MAWSTRELAELSGTTVNTVRHYHQVGLLDEPDRRSNGYKQYEVRHLVRLLQIRRLRDLGVPLDQIERVGSSGDSSEEALRAIDADLAATIARLQQARVEVQAILSGATVAGVPPGFEHVAGRLSHSERSLMLIYSQLYDDAAMADLRDMLASERDAVDDEFDSLPADADEATRQRIAERMVPGLAKHLADYPWLTDPTEHLAKSPQVTQNAFLESVVALYNPAQLDVMVRVSTLAAAQREGTA